MKEPVSTTVSENITRLHERVNVNCGANRANTDERLRTIDVRYPTNTRAAEIVDLLLSNESILIDFNI